MSVEGAQARMMQCWKSCKVFLPARWSDTKVENCWTAVASEVGGMVSSVGRSEGRACELWEGEWLGGGGVDLVRGERGSSPSTSESQKEDCGHSQCQCCWRHRKHGFGGGAEVSQRVQSFAM